MRLGLNQKAKVARAVPDGQRVLVSHRVPESSLEVLRDAGLDPVYGYGGAIALAPLIPGLRGGLRISPTIEGVNIRGRIGTLIIRRARALLASEYGEFPHTLSEPAVALCSAASERDLLLLRRALSAA